MTARVRSIGPEIDIIFGQNMARLRDELDWSPLELGKQIWLRTGEDLSVATILTIEDPRTGTPGQHRGGEAIAKTFEVPIDVMTKEIK